MQAMGKTAETKILYLHTIEANKYIAENLNLPLGAKVYKLKRIRIGDGMPLMVERTYLPGTIFRISRLIC